MKRNVLLSVLLVGIFLAFFACGGDAPKQEETPEPAKEKTEAPAMQQEDEGVLVAKEILATFDKAVAEAEALTKDKPVAAELQPKLEALYNTYETSMKELNVKYLALKEKDIALFGSANGYLGENRGKHVFKKDELLYGAISHYTSQGDEEILKILSKDLINLLEVAVKR